MGKQVVNAAVTAPSFLRTGLFVISRLAKCGSVWRIEKTCRHELENFIGKDGNYVSESIYRFKFCGTGEEYREILARK